MAAQKFFDYFQTTPAAKEAERRYNEEMLAERQKHNDAIRELQAEVKSTTPILRTAVAEAKARFEDAESEMKAAKHGLAMANAAESAFSLKLTAEIDRHKAALVQTADPRIDEFLQEISRLEEETRRNYYAKESRRFISGILYRLFYSNATLLNEKINAIRAARAKVNDLKLVVAVEDLAGELQKIKESIPELEGIEVTKEPVVRWDHRQGPVWTEPS